MIFSPYFSCIISNDSLFFNILQKIGLLSISTASRLIHFRPFHSLFPFFYTWLAFPHSSILILIHTYFFLWPLSTLTTLRSLVFYHLIHLLSSSMFIKKYINFNYINFCWFTCFLFLSPSWVWTTKL